MVFVPHSERRRTQDVLSRSSVSFASLHLSDTLRRALLLAGYRSPSPVQETAIPLVRLGTDLVVKAKSGTGKTLVFALACVDRVDASQPFPQALVLSPTREIAQQNATEIKKIANNLPFPNLSCGVFTGGVAVGEDRRRLRRPCQVVVATPGRLAWLVQKNEIQLDHVRLLVMDEADQLFTESLRPSVQFLLGALPTARQSLAFSATYASEILTEIEREMDYPQRVFIEEQQQQQNHTTTTTSSHKSSLIGVKQCYKMVEESPDDKVEDGLFERKVHALFEIFSSVSFHQAVVFCNSRERAEALSERLNASGFPSAFTAGHKSQEHRNRTMAAMRQFELRVIVSTDLIARGVDLERVNLVCNLDLPFDSETYQHRIGRTGRFGTYGISVTVVTPSELETLKQKYIITTAVPSHNDNNVQESSSLLIELPGQIPTEWYKDPLSSKEDQVAYQKLLEAPVAPDAVRHIPTSHAQWLGTVSKSEFTSWKERIEKKHAFWNHWDPYSCALSRSSSREGILRLATAANSEFSCETGSTSQRRTNCIRLPSRLSHTTSASSVVYSEEGECDCLDVDDDQLSWFETESHDGGESDAEARAEVHDAEVQTLAQKPPLMQPPTLPSTIESLADFEAVRGRYEQWRKEYSEWRAQFAVWYDAVQATAPPPPPPVI